MLSDFEKNLIQSTAQELITAGETVTRIRRSADTYDADFYEADTKTENTLEITAKVFFDREEFLMTPEGKEVAIATKVHVLPDADVQVGDLLEIRGVRYRVRERIEAPLGGYVELHLERI